nr:retrovirus-related Pol polyprotein from transposon TNT 1-94 [Tanacetum cinerariifolium]
MFDEYLEPPRVERPVLPAYAVQAPVNSAGTPPSTTIDKDAPSPTISPSSLGLQSHSLHQGVAAEPNYMKDYTIAPVNNTPFINVFAPKPHSEALSSGDIKAVDTACYTQNRSLIHTRHNKTPYELVHNKKPDLTFLRVFGSLFYPTNESEDLGKLQPMADIGIFVDYAPSKKGYRIHIKQTRCIMETIHVQFDELSELMAPVQLSVGPAPTFLTPRQISSRLVPNLVLAAPYVPPLIKNWRFYSNPCSMNNWNLLALKDLSLLLQ